MSKKRPKISQIALFVIIFGLIALSPLSADGIVSYYVVVSREMTGFLLLNL
jgi:hypothetical protein